MKHKIYIRGCYIESIFSMFYNEIQLSCGDGGATIVCSNPEEACSYYKDWLKQYIPNAGIREEFCTPTSIVTEIEENHIFSNDINSGHPEWGEITFVVMEDCIGIDKTKILKGINKE